MAASPYVKICGITRASDAALAADLGASAIGLNFVPGSKRRIDEERARAIADSVRDRIELVLVVADMPAAEMLRLRDALGADWLQLHGTESPGDLAAVLPKAFKAARIGAPPDVLAARAFGGPRLLVDAKVKGELGGAGVTFDWELVRAFAAERPLILAGGLTPENVGDALDSVHPWGVDVASGVESSPGLKDPVKMRAFLGAARRSLP